MHMLFISFFSHINIFQLRLCVYMCECNVGVYSVHVSVHVCVQVHVPGVALLLDDSFSYCFATVSLSEPGAKGETCEHEQSSQLQIIMSPCLSRQ